MGLAQLNGLSSVFTRIPLSDGVRQPLFVWLRIVPTRASGPASFCESRPFSALNAVIVCAFVEVKSVLFYEAWRMTNLHPRGQRYDPDRSIGGSIGCEC